MEELQETYEAQLQMEEELDQKIMDADQLSANIRKLEDAVEQMKHTLKITKEKNELAEATMDQKRRMLEEYTVKTERLDRKSKLFLGKMEDQIAELLAMIDVHKNMHEKVADVDPAVASRDIEDIAVEREEDLQKSCTEMGSSQQDDAALSRSLTALQNRCMTELPRIAEEGAKLRQEISRKWEAERRSLEKVAGQLEQRFKELSYHTRRGTNFKQQWKIDDKEESSSETLRLLLDFNETSGRVDEYDQDVQRLKRVHRDMIQEKKRLLEQCKKEEASLHKTYMEVHKERTQLGQERSELESICADFSSIIEQLEDQRMRECFAEGAVHVPMKSKGAPLATTYSIGHGRLSPRPFTGSPRRSVSPRPAARSPRASTPRAGRSVQQLTPRTSTPRASTPRASQGRLTSRH